MRCRQFISIRRFSSGLIAMACCVLTVAGTVHAQTEASAQTNASGAPLTVAGDVQLIPDGDGALLNVTLDRKAAYAITTLPDPFRVVVDLSGVRFREAGEQAGTSDGLVASYRFGGLSAGRSRMVIDTKGPAAVQQSDMVAIDGRFVLAIALKPTTEYAFGKAYRKRKRRETIARQDAETLAAIAKPEDRPRNAKRIVVLDPGHGGVDSGAVVSAAAARVPRTTQPVRKTPKRAPVEPQSYGKTGIVVAPQPPATATKPAKLPAARSPLGTVATGPTMREKDIVLAFAKALRKALQRTGKYEVLMTRSADTFVPLAKRVEFARRNSADLFISLHADSVGDPRFAKVSGTTVYTLSAKGSDSAAQEFAARENSSDVLAGVDLAPATDEVADILIELAQRETNLRSERFARHVLRQVGRQTRLNRGAHRSAAFVVLKAPDIPSVLIELGFLSNARDRRRLLSPAWRAKVAGALSSAVGRYFKMQGETAPF
ncbi:MAG: N-acetylmuramoyl-L-alanine amidase [Pseudomonadota bacterium]